MGQQIDDGLEESRCPTSVIGCKNSSCLGGCMDLRSENHCKQLTEEMPAELLEQEDSDSISSKRRKISVLRHLASCSSDTEDKELPTPRHSKAISLTCNPRNDAVECARHTSFERAGASDSEMVELDHDLHCVNLGRASELSNASQFNGTLYAPQMPCVQNNMVLMDIPIAWTPPQYCSFECVGNSSIEKQAHEKSLSEDTVCHDLVADLKCSTEASVDVPIMPSYESYETTNKKGLLRDALNILLKKKALNNAVSVSKLHNTLATGGATISDDTPRSRGFWHVMEDFSGEWHPHATADYSAIFSRTRKPYSTEIEDARNDQTYESLREMVKKHLLFLGWNVECKQDDSCPSICLVSPGGKKYYSLYDACMHLCKHELMVQSPKNDCRNLIGHSFISGIDQPFSTTVHSGPRSSKGVEEMQMGDSLALNLSKQEDFTRSVDLGCTYYLEAIVDFAKLYVNGKRKRNLVPHKTATQMRCKAKMHLSLLGWNFLYKPRKGGHELCYISPTGESYRSLHAACDACIKRLGCSKFTDRGIDVDANQTQNIRLSSDALSMLCKESECGSSWCLWQLRKLGFGKGGLRQRRARKGRKRRNSEQFMQYKLAIATFSRQHLYRRNPSRVPIRKGCKADKGCSTWALRSSERTLQVVEGLCPGQYSARTVLSWLMDNDVILPRQKVSYMHKKGQLVLAEGVLTREGIKCKCCRKVYSLAKFEVHAGSASLWPASSIFLPDGRSLMQCQMQLAESKKSGGVPLGLNERVKGDYSCCRRDSICSVCHYGGQLVSCDCCPSSFHSSCINLKALPTERWFCPSCKCAICGQSDYNANIQCFTPQSILICDQCEHEYHVKCLQERGHKKLESCPKGDWFCSRKCSKIFSALQKNLGNPKPMSSKGLCWTILRSRRENSYKSVTSACEAIAQCHSKLWVALSVLQECFIPITEPLTRRDLVTDLLFNSWSEFRRLNFRGFYTIILEKDDELISVAVVRIHGEKVAEMPLVATRVPYRRQGMCRLLVKEIEKLLYDLGVERLIVAAVPQLLDAWTTSFGFTKLTCTERLEFLEYSFFDFQGTTMCQKVLVPSRKKVKQPRGNKIIIQDWALDGIKGAQPNGCELISEVINMVKPICTLKAVPVLEFPSCREAHSNKEPTLYPALDFMQIEQEVVEKKSLDRACKFGDGVGFTDGFTPCTKMGQADNLQFRFKGLYYSRKRKSNVKIECPQNSYGERKLGDKFLVYSRRTKGARP